MQTTIETYAGDMLIEIPFEFNYHYDPGYLWGPPEKCYPPSEEFEWWHDLDHTRFNAVEWWDIQEIHEEVYYDAAMDYLTTLEL